MEEKIKNLFVQLKEESKRKDFMADDKYWEIKTELVAVISEKYNANYSVESLKAIRIPAGICSMIVTMEACIQGFDLTL